MSWCANGAIICDGCGHFCKPVDSWTPFGGTGDEGLEPHDPSHLCSRCWPGFKAKWARAFAKGSVYGDWQKSDAETEAATEAGLEWVGTSGLVDVRTDKYVHYRYIRADEKEHYVP